MFAEPSQDQDCADCFEMQKNKNKLELEGYLLGTPTKQYS